MKVVCKDGFFETKCDWLHRTVSSFVEFPRYFARHIKCWKKRGTEKRRKVQESRKMNKTFKSFVECPTLCSQSGACQKSYKLAIVLPVCCLPLFGPFHQPQKIFPFLPWLYFSVFVFSHTLLFWRARPLQNSLIFVTFSFFNLSSLFIRVYFLFCFYRVCFGFLLKTGSIFFVIIYVPLFLFFFVALVFECVWSLIFSHCATHL